MHRNLVRPVLALVWEGSCVVSARGCSFEHVNVVGDDDPGWDDSTRVSMQSWRRVAYGMETGRSLDLGKLIVVNPQQNNSHRPHDHCSRLALAHLVHGCAGLLDRHGILFDCQ